MASVSSRYSTSLKEPKAVAKNSFSTETCRQLLEAAADAIAVFNATGTIVFVNKQAKAMFGYKQGELRGQKIERLVPSRLQEMHRSPRRTLLNLPGAQFIAKRVGLVALRKDGHEFPVEVSLSPLHTKDAFLILSSIRDVSDRKDAEQALQQAK